MSAIIFIGMHDVTCWDEGWSCCLPRAMMELLCAVLTSQLLTCFCSHVCTGRSAFTSAKPLLQLVRGAGSPRSAQPPLLCT